MNLWTRNWLAFCVVFHLGLAPARMPRRAVTMMPPAHAVSVPEWKNYHFVVITFNGPSSSAPGAIASWHSPGPQSPTVTYAYDATSGNLLTVSTGTGPSGTNRTLTLAYTGNLLTSVADGTGRSVSYAFDGSGNLIQFTDPMGYVTSYAYDAANPGRMTQYFIPSLPFTAFITNTYDELGRVRAQTDAAGNTTNLYFAGTRTEMDDAPGNAHILYSSPRGKALIDIDGLGYQTVNTYDGLDRLASTTLPLGNSVVYTYDANSNPLSITSKAVPGSGLADAVQTLTYDPLWNKVATSTDPLGNITSYRYDEATGNLLQTVADVGGGAHFNATRKFSYDVYGGVQTATDPLGSVTYNLYDAAENLLSTTADYGPSRLNQTSSFIYDTLGKVTSHTDPLGNTSTLAYDASRRLLSATAPAPFKSGALLAQTSYTYDPDGRVTSVTRSNAGTPQITSMTYTSIGQLATRTDPNGNTTSFAYDLDDRQTSVTQPASLNRITRFTYDALGRPELSLGAPATRADKSTQCCTTGPRK